MSNFPHASSSGPAAPAEAKSRSRRSAWRTNVALISLLLSVWLAVAFVPGFYARDLRGEVLGWPFSFWMAAFGGPLAFLSIIGLYARLMNRGDAARRAGGN